MENLRVTRHFYLGRDPTFPLCVDILKRLQGRGLDSVLARSP